MLVAPDLHPYWLEALQRSGIRARSMEEIEDRDAGASVLFLPDHDLNSGRATGHRTRQLFERGLPVIAGARTAASLLGGGTRRAHAVGLSGAGALFHRCPSVRVLSNLDVLEDATLGSLWPDGSPAVGLIEDGGRLLIALPLPDPDALLGAPARMVSFALGGQQKTEEIVSSCDHGALRRLLCAAIRFACLRRGLPYVHLGPAPGEAVGGFAFRVDGDNFREDATSLVFDAMRKANTRATWFLDVERHARQRGGHWVERLQRAGHDVQNHGHHHYTYASRHRNQANFERGRQLLARWGWDFTAAAAPFGTWNPGLHRAYLDLGVRYSSEFSRLYDDHPGVLPGPQGTVPLWQVPIHPVCPAMLFKAGLDVAEACRYFGDRVREAIGRGEPAVLYGHPIDDLEHCPQLFEHLRGVLADEEVRAQGPIWRGTLSELHAFYEQRSSQEVTCVLGPEGLHVESSGPAALWVDVGRGDPIRVVGDATVSRDELLERATASPVFPSSGSPPAGDPQVVIDRGWAHGARHRLAQQHRRLGMARAWRELKGDLRSLVGATRV